jgi:hypothetical protein
MRLEAVLQADRTTQSALSRAALQALAGDQRKASHPSEAGSTLREANPPEKRKKLFLLSWQRCHRTPAAPTRRVTTRIAEFEASENVGACA